MVDFEELKISIITATYNCEDVIESALNSVAEQIYNDIEHIVIDGLSTDRTIQILKNRNVKLISERDDGIYDALNKGVKISSGDVIGFLHADDEFASRNVISKIAEVFQSDSSVSAVYGDLVYVLRKDSSRIIRYWKSKSYNDKLIGKGWMPPHPTLYVRKDFYQKVGGFSLNYKIASDYFFILSLFTLPNFKSVHLPEILVKMKLGGESNHSIKAILKKSHEDWSILRKLGFNTIFSLKVLMLKNLSKLNQFRLN